MRTSNYQHAHVHDHADVHDHAGEGGGRCSDQHSHAGESIHSHTGELIHSHLSHADTAQKLAFSVVLTVLVLGAEVLGGLLSHSLALLSDAAHMVTDVAA